MNCACRFDDKYGTPQGLCSYHEKAMKFLAREARDAERKRIVQVLDERGLKVRLHGNLEMALILLGLAKEIRDTKAPIHCAVLKSTREDLLR